MICPVCNRPTTRMVYRRTGKLCPDCADPNFIHALEPVPFSMVPLMMFDHADPNFLRAVDPFSLSPGFVEELQQQFPRFKYVGPNPAQLHGPPQHRTYGIEIVDGEIRPAQAPAFDDSIGRPFKS